MLHAARQVAFPSAHAKAAAKPASGTVLERTVRSDEARPLDSPLRRSMEAWLQTDFSHVRVHSGERAASLAEGLRAAAFTQGSDIVFARGQLAPHQPAGLALIAHELTHVAQQHRGSGPAPGDGHEAEAAAAARAPYGAGFRVSLASAPGAIQRSPGHRLASTKQALVRAAWSDEEWDFEEAVVAAIARSDSFRNVPEDELPFAFYPPSGALFASLEPRRLRRGQKLAIRVSAYYDPQLSPAFQSVSVTLAEAPATTGPPSPAAGASAGSSAGAAPDGRPTTRPRNTDPAPRSPASDPRHPSLQDQTGSVRNMSVTWAVQADRGGWAGMKLTVRFTGTVLELPSMEMVGPQAARPSGMMVVPEMTARQELDPFLSAATSHPGLWAAEFGRGPNGAMHLQRWRVLPDAPAPQAPVATRRTPAHHRSPAEEFEAETGWVYPQRINRHLQQVAIAGLHEADPFSLKNLPYTIGGVIIPIGGMKLLTADADTLGNLVRFEWRIEANLADATEAQTAARSTAGATGAEAAQPARELAVGDVVDTPRGQQRVVTIQPDRIVTETYTPSTSTPRTTEQPTPSSSPERAGPSATPSRVAPTAARLAPANIKAGMELDPVQSQVFRGGDGFELGPDHYKLDPKTQLVKPTHGLSLDVNPDNLTRFGSVRQIRSIPPELKIVQRGGRIEHFEIMPREPMTVERFQALLLQVTVW